MSDGISDMYREMRRERERNARFDAACYAIAHFLGLPCEGKEDWNVMDEFCQHDLDRPLGLDRLLVTLARMNRDNVAAMDVARDQLTRRVFVGCLSVLTLACRLLSLAADLPDATGKVPRDPPEYSRPMVWDIIGNLFNDDRETWARLLVATWHTRWRLSFHGASPFAHDTVQMLSYRRRHCQHPEALDPEFNVPATNFIVDLAERRGYCVKIVTERDDFGDLRMIAFCALPANL